MSGAVVDALEAFSAGSDSLMLRVVTLRQLNGVGSYLAGAGSVAIFVEA